MPQFIIVNNEIQKEKWWKNWFCITKCVYVKQRKKDNGIGEQMEDNNDEW